MKTPSARLKAVRKSTVDGLVRSRHPAAEEPRAEADEAAGEAREPDQAGRAHVLQQPQRHAGQRRLPGAGQQADDKEQGQGQVGPDASQRQRRKQACLNRDDQQEEDKIVAGFHFVSTSASSRREKLTIGRAVTVWNALASCLGTCSTVATGRPLGNSPSRPEVTSRSPSWMSA